MYVATKYAHFKDTYAMVRSYYTTTENTCANTNNEQYADEPHTNAIHNWVKLDFYYFFWFIFLSQTKWISEFNSIGTLNHTQTKAHRSVALFHTREQQHSVIESISISTNPNLWKLILIR